MGSSSVINATSQSNKTYIEAFKSKPGQGCDFIDFISDFLQGRNWTDQDINAVNIAMIEAVNNAIDHGNERNPDKWVCIRCEISNEMISIAIRDQGNGFNPDDIPDPRQPDRIECSHGRGVFMMRNLMSNVWYNSLGNIVFMEKSRTTA